MAGTYTKTFYGHQECWIIVKGGVEIVAAPGKDAPTSAASARGMKSQQQ